MDEKVLAYIIRNHKDTYQLLVHIHRHIPQAGLQIPAGTVDPGENLQTAMQREIAEESGLSDLPAGEMIASSLFFHPEKQALQLRHFFLIHTTQQLAVTWDHQVFGDGADHGMIFRYTWLDINSVPALAASQDQFLNMVRKKLFDTD